MKNFKLHHKIAAILLALFFFFQSMNEINSHTYTIGFENSHNPASDGIISCFGFGTSFSHSSYECGKPFHIR